ncbi:MAG: methyltransferase domain-containing protein [Aquabacterium sp.]|nr:MAG: methyltransferase domain-containing protein [Aquabacterium sp.]
MASSKNGKRKGLQMEPANMSESRGVRYLHLGTPWIQGAMRVSKPDDIELEYVQRMMVWLLLRPLDEWADLHAVQLGLGAAAITKFCRRKLGMHTTAVEINETVIELCREWFRLGPDDERLQVVHADARSWLDADGREGSADALCVDLYDHDAASPVLDDAEFYAACHRLLAPGGVMTVNLFGRNAAFKVSVERMAESFGMANLVSLKPTREGNAIVLACKQVAWPSRELLVARAEAVAERFALPAQKWVKLLGVAGDEDAQPPPPG